MVFIERCKLMASNTPNGHELNIARPTVLRQTHFYEALIEALRCYCPSDQGSLLWLGAARNNLSVLR